MVLPVLSIDDIDCSIKFKKHLEHIVSEYRKKCEYSHHENRNRNFLALQYLALFSGILTLFRGGFFRFFLRLPFTLLRTHHAEQTVEVLPHNAHQLFDEVRHRLSHYQHRRKTDKHLKLNVQRKDMN